MYSQENLNWAQLKVEMLLNYSNKKIERHTTGPFFLF